MKGPVGFTGKLYEYFGLKENRVGSLQFNFKFRLFYIQLIIEGIFEKPEKVCAMKGQL